MPIAQIYLMEGRSEAQKRAAIEKVTQALVESVGASADQVRVLIHELPKAHWGIAGTPAADLGR